MCGTFSHALFYMLRRKSDDREINMVDKKIEQILQFKFSINDISSQMGKA